MRDSQRGVEDRSVLGKLKDNGVLVKTPRGRPTSEGRVSSYDDRFILKLAASKNAVVVSNDHFRDLLKEEQFRETIEKRILPFTFYNDMFMPAEDPQGRHGLTLDQLLRNDPLSATGGVCPYGRKCTYGTKCKFRHPEREIKNNNDTVPDSGYDTMSSKSVKSSGSDLSQTTSVTTTPPVLGEMSRLSVNQRRRARFDMNQPSLMPLQVNGSQQQPHSWGPGPSVQHLTRNSYPYSLPPSYQQHPNTTSSYPNSSELVGPRTQPLDRQHSHLNYHHPAHRAHQHVHPMQQEAYYSVPLEGSPGVYFKVEMTNNSVPMRQSQTTNATPQPPPSVAQLSQPTAIQSQPFAVVTQSQAQSSVSKPPATTAVDAARKAVADRLAKTFNPDLVNRVMSQNPHLSDIKQLRALILESLEDSEDEC